MEPWIEQYLALMAGDTVTPDMVKQARELKDQNLPAKLYKFRNINDYALSNLENGTIWLSSVDQFNDPYECSILVNSEVILRDPSTLDVPSVKKSFTLQEIAAIQMASDPNRKLIELLHSRDPSISSEQTEDNIRFMNEIVLSRFGDLFHVFSFALKTLVRICSFSARNDSVVMWGHYANSHSGFCVEYDLSGWSSDKALRHSVYPVVYSENIFDITGALLRTMKEGLDGSPISIIAAMYKSPYWSYEEEWRLIFPKGSSLKARAGLTQQVPKPSAIYLGTRMSETDEDKLKTIAKRKSIPVYKMSMSTTEYKLVPSKLEL